MKYAISCLVRFETKELRDAAFDTLKTKAGKLTFRDSFIQTHKCYHDEDPAKPCEIEENITSDS